MLIKKPQVIVVSGHPGAGKSTLANGLAEKLGFPALSVDTVAGALAPRLFSSEEECDQAATLCILAQIEQAARNGSRVVVDVRGNPKDLWPQFEAVKDRVPMVRYLPLFLQADFDTCEERLLGRVNASSSDPRNGISREALLREFEDYSDFDFKGLIKMEARRSREELLKNAVALIYANLLT